MGYYSAITDESLPFETSMGLEGIMLSEENQRKKTSTLPLHSYVEYRDKPHRRTNDIKHKNTFRGRQQTYGHQREAERRRGRMGEEGQLWVTDGDWTFGSINRCQIMTLHT